MVVHDVGCAGLVERGKEEEDRCAHARRPHEGRRVGSVGPAPWDSHGVLVEQPQPPSACCRERTTCPAQESAPSRRRSMHGGRTHPSFDSQVCSRLRSTGEGGRSWMAGTGRTTTSWISHPNLAFRESAAKACRVAAGSPPQQSNVREAQRRCARIARASDSIASRIRARPRTPETPLEPSCYPARSIDAPRTLCPPCRRHRRKSTDLANAIRAKAVPSYRGGGALLLNPLARPACCWCGSLGAWERRTEQPPRAAAAAALANRASPADGDIWRIIGFLPFAVAAASPPPIHAEGRRHDDEKGGRGSCVGRTSRCVARSRRCRSSAHSSPSSAHNVAFYAASSLGGT
jgi:hypothetical protein